VEAVTVVESLQAPARMSRREQLRWRGFRAVLRARQWAAMPTASRRALPDFLVVGGQRCGTTSLYRYLDQHPSVLFPRLTKGTHWFDEEYHRSERWYRSNFPLERVRADRRAASGGPVVVGEACPYYMFHPAVPGRIAEHLPEVKVVAILRDPVARAWSAYHHEHRRGYETLGFADALDAEEGRLAGADDALTAGPTRHLSHQHHGYVARGRYAEQVERLWAHLGRERCLVLYSADLERDPSAVMQRVHEVLGIPLRPTPTTDRWNSQDIAPISTELQARLRAEFAASDGWLAEHLEEPPPWRT
jgi:hypothetical protein